MKKMRAKWLILCMTVVMALLFLQEDRVQAAQSKLMHISTGKVTIEEGKKWYIDLQNVPLGAKVKGISNDEQVATWKDGIIYGVKSGTTSIVVKVSYQEQNKKKTKKYPIKSIKITNLENGVDLAYKLDQRADYAGEQQRGLTFTKKAKRPQVSVTAADGWIITGGYVDAYWGSYQKFTNVNAADWQFRMKGTAAKGFSDLFLVVNLQNKLTGATQSVSLGYYPYE